MRTLVKTNDPIVLNYIGVLLKGAGIASSELDVGMSAMEGSIGVLPKRLAVADLDYAEAKKLVTDAGLGQWIEDDEQG